MTKEQKQILKNIQKQVKIVLKKEVKKNNWKISSYSIYNIIDDFFIHAIWIVRIMENKCKMILKYNIKSYSSDIILWDILQMKENEKKADSPKSQWEHL